MTQTKGLVCMQKNIAFVTGAAGFIGFHVSKKLLEKGWRVIGFDCMSDYYDVSLKQERERILKESNNYISIHEKLETPEVLLEIFRDHEPSLVVHLAAQAGVRYSLEEPRSYLDSNVIGTYELLEAARAYPPRHVLIASTSSAYGATQELPYHETQKSDQQISFYAATKKATESIAHSYSHMFNLPVTVFRFFTVYGPWGRPDMALFKFTKAMLADEKIDVYNNGNMSRDFTYIDDLVQSILLLIDVIPPSTGKAAVNIDMIDSLSSVAPYRIVNIGNSKSEKLMSYVAEIEQALQRKAKINFLPMQAGCRRYKSKC